MDILIPSASPAAFVTYLYKGWLLRLLSFLPTKDQFVSFHLLTAQ